jgi:hypothetical protein
MRTLADYPEFLLQLHPNNNLDLATKSLSYGSKSKLYWRCDLADDQMWYAAVNERAEAGDR